MSPWRGRTHLGPCIYSGPQSCQWRPRTGPGAPIPPISAGLGLRILHVANFTQMIAHRELEKMGLIFHDTPCKLTNGLIRNGQSVFQLSDREIARAAAWWSDRRLGDEAHRAVVEKGWRKAHAVCDVDWVVRYMLAFVFDEPFKET